MSQNQIEYSTVIKRKVITMEMMDTGPSLKFEISPKMEALEDKKSVSYNLTDEGYFNIF